MTIRAKTRKPGLLSSLRAGLITGAADDDPSGIGTYSQAGAQFGYTTTWSLLFTFPLMVGIQLVCARIGRVTGRGLAANIGRHHSPGLLLAVVLLLFVANTINIAADLAAMAEVVKLLVGGPAQVYVVGFALVSAVLQVFLPFRLYSPFLKFLTLALFSYVAAIFVIDVPWALVLRNLVWPSISASSDYIVIIVAILGTTISPYLFFWQAAEEVEEQREEPGARPLKVAPSQARDVLARIDADTYFGMGFSNLIAFFIMVTTAATLHANGVTDIQTAAQAAQALQPIAGELAFALFAVGIVGTGMLAIPVLAGATAYAVAETFRWPEGLNLKPRQGRRFYAVLALSILVAVGLTFTPIDPIDALLASAVINGLVAAPIMIVLMLLAQRADVMGAFVVRGWVRLLGWLATLAMAAAALALLATSMLPG